MSPGIDLGISGIEGRASEVIKVCSPAKRAGWQQSPYFIQRMTHKRRTYLEESSLRLDVV